MPSGSNNVRDRLRGLAAQDTTGGILLIIAAIVALAVANSPASHWYHRLATTAIGPAYLGPFHVALNLTVEQWAADGLLAIFFLVVGLELAHELRVGSLSNVRQAAVPMLAAVGGMAVPAIIFTVITETVGHGYGIGGWAIPTATDIAFALAVLGVFGKGLPPAVRTFLLTLAVVDDLLAIVIIAAFYSHHMNWWALVGAVAVVAVYYFYVRTRRPNRWLLIAMFVAAWVFMHASGVHATIAGVMFGLVTPVRPKHDDNHVRALRYGHRISPWSQLLVLPVFAFFAAGVSVTDDGGFVTLARQPVVLAVVLALVVGKLIGVMGTTALVTHLTPLRLADGLTMRDLLPVGFLAGIGFTVALLVSELSYGPAALLAAGAKLAILCASGLAAALGAVTLRIQAGKENVQK
ncbi:MAG: Na+/H+ antiporter NhaA [Cellulomonadaceae bacterium]|jgi:NhaA family Na+:H+ antiporter|nr:Na+/H+ antiporter NhaA [Cellulomonadaceae bacterium]